MKLNKNQTFKAMFDGAIIIFHHKLSEWEYTYDKHKKLHDSCIEYSRQCYIENSRTYRGYIIEIWESNNET